MKVKISLSRLVEQTCVIELDELEINVQEYNLYDWASIAAEEDVNWEFECVHEGAMVTHINWKPV